MSSLLASLRSWFSRPADDLPLASRLEGPSSGGGSGSGASRAGLFKPFQRGGSSASQADSLAPLTDVLVSVREAVERQSQRHEELMTYLSHLPKAMELIPENSKLQSEALAAIRQHLENQGTQAKQMATILDKVGQATVDQRRILDSVRQRLDMLAENDQKVAEHFSTFSTALVSSADTTKVAGELLRSLEANIRTRDEALERILTIHQTRHTWMLAAAIAMATAALVATSVGLFYLANR